MFFSFCYQKSIIVRHCIQSVCHKLKLLSFSKVPKGMFCNLLDICDALHSFNLKIYMYQNVCVSSCCSCVWLFVTPWTVDCQAPLSMGSSKQQYWSRLPFPSAGGLPYPGILFLALTGRFVTTAPPAKPIPSICVYMYLVKNPPTMQETWIRVLG